MLRDYGKPDTSSALSSTDNYHSANLAGIKKGTASKDWFRKYFHGSVIAELASSECIFFDGKEAMVGHLKIIPNEVRKYNGVIYFYEYLGRMGLSFCSNYELEHGINTNWKRSRFKSDQIIGCIDNLQSDISGLLSQCLEL